MAQYLVNATMIWLLSLLAFDLLLRRESYHAYNRLYLLFTFLLGIFLPLWQWDAGGNVYNTVTGSGTISAVITVKESIVHTTALPQDNPDHTNWIWVIYIAGVAVSALFFFREAFMLFKYFHKGKKSKDGVWSIIETGEKHSPFSAFRYIFISNKSDYSTEELNMILLHEELHGHALHFVDTMIMQLAKIIFWFHPLIYLYNKRLLLLHEYQADAAASENPVTYGHFLVQQALLTPAPSLSHSFNRSPIKNRIVMLTRKSSFTAGFKRLIAMPLLIICTFLFSQNVLSQDMRQEGGKVYYRGNVFELWSPKDTPDTIMVENPMTGDIEMRISRVDSFPVRMNGEEIFRVSELSRMEKETFDRTTGAEVKKYFLEKRNP